MANGQGRPFRIEPALVGGFCAGLLGQWLAPVLLPWAWGLALGLGAVLALARSGTGWRLLAGALVGFAWMAVQAHVALAQRLPADAEGAVVRVDGRITGLPETRPEGARWVFDVERVVEGDRVLAARLEGRRLALRWYRGGHMLRAGERWRFDVRLAVPQGQRLPGGDDPARRALLAGTVAEGRVDAARPPLRIGTAMGIDAWRERRSEALREGLGDTASRSVRALAIGDTRGLDDADWRLLRDFGLTHLIAISGLHVGMVAGLGALLVRGLYRGAPGLARLLPLGTAACWGALAVGAAYALAAGASLPTLRTVFMIAVLAMARSWRWPIPPLQALLLAAIALLVFDPFVIATPGFWLSCGGVLWLVACLPRGTSAWSPMAFLRAQWVATLGLLPVVAACFGAVPVLGPVANLVAIPWISLVAVPLSLLGLLLEPLHAGAALWIWQCAASAMQGLEALLVAVPGALRGAWPTPHAGPLPVLLALLAVYWLLQPRGVPCRALAPLLALPLLLPVAVRPARGDAELWVLALSRGDAVLLRTTDHDVLIDAGPRGDGVARALAALDVRALDLVVLTRGNAGRVGGLPAVIERGTPRRQWAAAGSSAARHGPVCGPGQSWSSDGWTLEAVHPHAGVPTGDGESSCVLRLRRGAAAWWLAGDAGRWTVGRLLREAGDPRIAGVLAAPRALEGWRRTGFAGHGFATRGEALQGGTLRLRLGRDGALSALDRWPALEPRWWDPGRAASSGTEGPTGYAVRSP